MKWTLKDILFAIISSINVTLAIPLLIVCGGFQRDNKALEKAAQYETFGYYDKNIDLLNLKNPFDWMGGLGIGLILIAVSIIMYWCFDVCWRFACEQKRKEVSEESNSADKRG